jgi:hypothetical protein
MQKIISDQSTFLTAFCASSHAACCVDDKQDVKTVRYGLFGFGCYLAWQLKKTV